MAVLNFNNDSSVCYTKKDILWTNKIEIMSPKTLWGLYY